MQHGFWGGAQGGVAPIGAPAGSRQTASVKRYGVTGAAGRDFHDPGGADPGFSDLLSGLCRYAIACGFGAQRLGDVAAMANLVIPCPKREGSGACPGTEIGSDDATSSGCPTPSEKPAASWLARRRPPAPGAPAALPSRGLRLRRSRPGCS